jgi:hypothetical protein
MLPVSAAGGAYSPDTLLTTLSPFYSQGCGEIPITQAVSTTCTLLIKTQNGRDETLPLIADINSIT